MEHLQLEQVQWVSPKDMPPTASSELLCGNACLSLWCAEPAGLTQLLDRLRVPHSAIPHSSLPKDKSTQALALPNIHKYTHTCVYQMSDNCTHSIQNMRLLKSSRFVIDFEKVLKNTTLPDYP